MSDTVKDAASIISTQVSAAFKNPAGRWAVFIGVVFLSIPCAEHPGWLILVRPVFQAAALAMIAFPACAFLVKILQRRTLIRELRKLGRDEMQVLREYISQDRACHYINVLSNGPALALNIKGILVCPLAKYIPHSCPMILFHEVRDLLRTHPEIVGLTIEDLWKAPFKNLDPEPYDYIKSPE